MRKNIILVEAVSPLRLRVRDVLTENKYNVYDISDGQQLIKANLFRQKASEPGLLDMITPELFVLSLELEDMNGIELLSIIKSHEKFINIPVIVTSSHNDRDTIIAAVTKGATDYVLKRDNFVQTLFDKIVKLVERSQNTFEAVLKREIEWVRFGKRELSFAIVKVQDKESGAPLNKKTLEEITKTLAKQMRHYDWIFPLSNKKLGLILPITTLKDVVILRDRLFILIDDCSKRTGVAVESQIGFSHFPVNAKTAKELIALAEEQIT